jgi:hypothetical protein
LQMRVCEALATAEIIVHSGERMVVAPDNAVDDAASQCRVKRKKKFGGLDQNEFTTLVVY